MLECLNDCLKHINRAQGKHSNIQAFTLGTFANNFPEDLELDRRHNNVRLIRGDATKRNTIATLCTAIQRDSVLSSVLQGMALVWTDWSPTAGGVQQRASSPTLGRYLDNILAIVAPQLCAIRARDYARKVEHADARQRAAPRRLVFVVACWCCCCC
jgi:hypothetical protein